MLTLLDARAALRRARLTSASAITAAARFAASLELALGSRDLFDPAPSYVHRDLKALEVFL